MSAEPFVQAQIKENIKAPRHWPLWGNPPVIGGFPSQRASNAENVSIWWWHHDFLVCSVEIKAWTNTIVDDRHLFWEDNVRVLVKIHSTLSTHIEKILALFHEVWRGTEFEVLVQEIIHLHDLVANWFTSRQLLLLWCFCESPNLTGLSYLDQLAGSLSTLPHNVDESNGCPQALGEGLDLGHQWCALQ